MRVGLKKKKRQNIKTYNRLDLALARDRGQRQRSEGGWVENLRGGFLQINVMNTVSGLPLFYIHTHTHTHTHTHIYIYIYIYY